MSDNAKNFIFELEKFLNSVMKIPPFIINYTLNFNKKQIFYDKMPKKHWHMTKCHI